MSHLDQPLRDLLANKLYEILAHYGFGRWFPTHIPERSNYMCCVLGFTGDHINGSVIIAATQEAILDTNPIAAGPGAAWVAELTNQLVGRFKNELVRCGLEISIGQPVVLTATKIMPLAHRSLAPIVTGIGGGVVSAWLDIDYGPEAKLQPPRYDVVPPEGATLMF